MWNRDQPTHAESSRRMNRNWELDYTQSVNTWLSLKRVTNDTGDAIEL